MSVKISTISSRFYFGACLAEKYILSWRNERKMEKALFTIIMKILQFVSIKTLAVTILPL